MGINVPAMRESEHAIETLRAAEASLWAERLADLLARVARLGEAGVVIREETAVPAAESSP